MLNFESMYKDKIQWQKVIDFNILCYVQEKNPIGFFIQINFFQTFDRHFLP